MDSNYSQNRTSKELFMNTDEFCFLVYIDICKARKRTNIMFEKRVYIVLTMYNSF